MSFRAIWICRAVPLPIWVWLAPATVWVERPKLGLINSLPGGPFGFRAHPGKPGVVGGGTDSAVQMPPSGLAKFGWFRMLNKSARSCSFTDSVIWKFFIPDMSHWKKPGPRSALRPTVPLTLPHWPSKLGSTANAPKLKLWSGQLRLASNKGWPGTKLGRMGLTKNQLINWTLVGNPERV